MENQSYLEILKLNAELKHSLEEAKQYKVTILSNIIIHQIKEILEFSLRVENINAVINIGDYDNIIQDSMKVVGSNVFIVFWELCNLFEGLNYKIEQLEDDQINKIAEKTCSEIDLTFKNLETSSLVLVNKFSSAIFPFPSKTKSNFDKLANILNKHISNFAPKNVKLVDLERVFYNIGVHKSIDLRYYYSSKALYTIDFFKAYSRLVKPFIMSEKVLQKK